MESRAGSSDRGRPARGPLTCGIVWDDGGEGAISEPARPHVATRPSRSSSIQPRALAMARMHDTLHGHEGRSLPGQHQRGGGRPAHRGTCDSTRGRDPVNAVRYLLLIGGDTGGDLVDTARYLLLTGGDPVEAARQPLLTGCDTCGELVNALPHHVERYCVQLLLIGR